MPELVADNKEVHLDFLAARQMIDRNLALCDADEVQDIINDNSGLLADLPNFHYVVWPEGCRVGEVQKVGQVKKR